MPVAVVISLAALFIVFLTPALAAFLRPSFARVQPQVECQPWKTFKKRIVRTR